MASAETQGLRGAREASASLVKYTVQILKQVVRASQGPNSPELVRIEEEYKRYLRSGSQHPDAAQHHSMFIDRARAAVGSKYVDEALRILSGVGGISSPSSSSSPSRAQPQSKSKVQANSPSSSKSKPKPKPKPTPKAKPKATKAKPAKKGKSVRGDLIRAILAARQGKAPDDAAKQLYEHIITCVKPRCGFKTTTGTCALAKTFLRKGAALNDQLSTTNSDPKGPEKQAMMLAVRAESRGRGRGRGSARGTGRATGRGTGGRGRGGRGTGGRGRGGRGRARGGQKSPTRKRKATDSEVDFDRVAGSGVSPPLKQRALSGDKGKGKSKPSTAEKLRMIKEKRLVASKTKLDRLVPLGRKSGSPKASKVANEFAELEECGVRVKDTEDDVVRLTGIDDEKEAEENIRVGRLGTMSIEDTSREYWINTHLLHAKSHFERMKSIADSSIPPLRICGDLNQLGKCRRIEYIARAIQEYLEVKLSDLVRLAKHRQAPSPANNLVVTADDLKTLIALQGEIF